MDTALSRFTHYINPNLEELHTKSHTIKDSSVMIQEAWLGELEQTLLDLLRVEEISLHEQCKLLATAKKAWENLSAEVKQNQSFLVWAKSIYFEWGKLESESSLLNKVRVGETWLLNQEGLKEKLPQGVVLMADFIDLDEDEVALYNEKTGYDNPLILDPDQTPFTKLLASTGALNDERLTLDNIKDMINPVISTSAFTASLEGSERETRGKYDRGSKNGSEGGLELNSHEGIIWAFEEGAKVAVLVCSEDNAHSPLYNKALSLISKSLGVNPNALLPDGPGFRMETQLPLVSREEGLITITNGHNAVITLNESKARILKGVLDKMLNQPN